MPPTRGPFDRHDGPGPKALAPSAGVVWRGWRSLVLLAIVVLVAVASTLGTALAQISQPKFPELTGRVVDEAGIIKYEDRKALEAELAALEAKSTDQVAVVTVKSLQGYEIEEYGYQLGRKWGIGQQGKDNGVILIVAPNERKVRIEVGRRLEPILPDGLTGTIIRNRILPAFRRGDFSGGIRAGVKDITDTLSGDAEAVKERAKGGVRKSPEVDTTGLVILAIWLGIFLLIVYLQMRQARQMPASVGRQRRRGWDDGNVIVIPGGFGGGWSGGGGGDSGWSGGGGDFGGGGSSGSW